MSDCYLICLVFGYVNMINTFHEINFKNYFCFIHVFSTMINKLSNKDKICIISPTKLLFLFYFVNSIEKILIQPTDGSSGKFKEVSVTHQ